MRAAADYTPRFILASKSPRRRALLEQVGICFTVVAPDVDEAAVLGDGVAAYPPEEMVLRLARAKAREVSGRISPGLVLGADTSVLSPDGEVLGKPANAEDARRMLWELSGATHQVYTGLVLRDQVFDREVSAVSCTRVTVRTLDESWISWYISTGEPFGKAGSYAIQGHGGLFVREIVGSYANVVGLPLDQLPELFRCLGYPLKDYMI